MKFDGPFIPEGYISAPDAIYRYMIVVHSGHTQVARSILVSREEGERRAQEDYAKLRQPQGEKQGGNIVFLPKPAATAEQLMNQDKLISSWRMIGERGVRELLFSGAIEALTVDQENNLAQIPAAFWASSRADAVLFSETLVLRDGASPEVFFLPKEAFEHLIASKHAEMVEGLRPKAADELIDIDPDHALKSSLTSRRPGRPGSLKEDIKARMRLIDPAILSKMTWKELHRAVGEAGTRTTLTDARKEVLAEVPEIP